MLPMNDFIIIGAGISGILMAKELTDAGAKVLLLEAGKYFNRDTYPRKEIDANSQMYWGGGIELNKEADIGFLRPKVVGGGSIVNQALLDRFDDVALKSWQEQSGVDFFTTEELRPWYEKAEQSVHIEEIPALYRNANADIFIEGFEKLGFQCAPLKRAQKNCQYEAGNDCIECLAGCKLDSKQSTAITALPQALKNGLELKSEFEVLRIEHKPDQCVVHAKDSKGHYHSFKAKNIVLASGAIGNSRLLLNSGMQKKLPMLGKNFYTHPQFMSLGLYEQKINAHKGPFQAMKSNDPSFRINSFKLENVFAPPVALSMLLPGIGREHMRAMKKLSHYACIEVAIRDQNPGQIKVNGSGRVQIHKNLDRRDRETKKKGEAIIHQIFSSTGAKKIIDGNLSIGLHLMGGLGIGPDKASSVVNQEFEVHDHKNIFCADSSIFPNAPGINPSLTIMALSYMAADKILKRASL